jgi:predicted metal-dependent hydrolase
VQLVFAFDGSAEIHPQTITEATQATRRLSNPATGTTEATRQPSHAATQQTQPTQATQATQATQPPQATQATQYVRHPRARRYVLRVNPDGSLRVTIPRRGSKREAVAFAARHAAWIARQRARLLAPAVPVADQQSLKRRARIELPLRLRELAAMHGLTIGRVSIRNQRSRWGSCGPDGHICLNWRLVLMPDWVRDYVLIHELMHLRRLDHSPAYWRLVATACPNFRQARLWLRAHGPEFR